MPLSRQTRADILWIMPPLLILAAVAANVAVASVHDGDTVRLWSGERVRLAGIDAPERSGSPRCIPARRSELERSANPAWCDDAAARRSTAALAAFLATGPVEIHRTGATSYGRTLARLTVNGHDAGDYLVAHGLARKWQSRR